MAVYKLLEEYLWFPDPNEADEEGLVAVGGDFSPERVLLALCSGIFPWPCDEMELLWFSLDPRFVVFPEKAHISKSLRRSCRNFTVRVNSNFEAVIRRCASVERAGQEGTWITENIISAYTKLHDYGYGYSFETYQGDKLVGGLYGNLIGRVFTGESMFHEVTDAGKVAFCALVDFCLKNDVVVIDCQQKTDLLASLGGEEIPRAEYLNLLKTYGVFPFVEHDDEQ
ncbi:MAG: leucyl/phenylalanyl-tRNA--protein transferase [Bacteroidales bacterium]|nr:leucyl/phenylalanyl-tRNA--protein transferase [Bacteroidales bacterium]